MILFIHIPIFNMLLKMADNETVEETITVKPETLRKIWYCITNDLYFLSLISISLVAVLAYFVLTMMDINL